MPKVEMVKGKGVPLGERRAVHVYLEEGEDSNGYIFFECPIERGDLKDGKAIPRARAKRHKSQLITQLILSKETLHALKRLLNETLVEE